MLGIVASKVFISLSSEQRHKLRLHQLALPTIVVCIALLYLASATALPFPHEMVTGVLLAPLSVALIVALSSEPVGITGLMTAELPVLLGESNFALYLLHVPLWQLFVWLKLGGVRSHYVGFLLAAVLISICSFQFFNGPWSRQGIDAILEQEGRGRSLTLSIGRLGDS